MFFAWLEKNGWQESILQDKKCLKKAVGKYIDSVAATSKGAWNCFITALNIATAHWDRGLKLTKDDLPRFVEKVDPKFKHQAYSSEQ